MIDNKLNINNITDLVREEESGYVVPLTTLKD